MQVYRYLLLIAILLMELFPTVGRTHPLDPALLEFKESSNHLFDVIWKTPASKVADEPLRPFFPSGCQVISTEVPDVSNVAVVQRFRMDCTPQGLTGGVVRVEGLGVWKTDALLRIELADGATIRAVLREDQDSFQIPPKQGLDQVARDYIAMGIEHILFGWDHLLFVLGLVLLVRSKRILLWTITSFTLGHCVTLSLAALGIVRIPQAPVEVLIALSILVVAVEMSRVERRGTSSIIDARYSPAIAGVFGLLHGLGFASALMEVGLPSKEIPLALMTFNIGIEIGQLMFVAAALGLIAFLGSLNLRWPKFAYKIPAYVIGSLSSFWILDRIARLH